MMKNQILCETADLGKFQARRTVMKNIFNAAFSGLARVRSAIPDNIYYGKWLVPLRLLYGGMIKNRKRKRLRFDVHAADHCNINCMGCEHFSPLAPVNFIDIEKYERDLEKLAALGGGKIDDIALLGGEPLLCPQINPVMKISRFYFPDAEIKIITNGVLLKNQPDEFWDCCRVNGVIVTISVYPVHLDAAFIYGKAKKHGVQIQFRGNVKLVSENQAKLPLEYVSENWRELPIDIHGAQNPWKSNALCYASNFCFQLREGKLYKCWRAAYIKFFNSYFNTDLKVTGDDYIDIHRARSMDEILDKLRRPIPFCRYCKMDGAGSVKWARSQKDISEWIIR
jgi:sulfatase maturation enzyme AslB (radical SAM superfamily)